MLCLPGMPIPVSPAASALPPPFQAVLDRDESILWQGTPAWLPFVIQGVPFLVVGCLWAAIDYFGFIRHMRLDGPQAGFLIPFFLLHLFPFWASVLNLLRLLLVHRNTFYAFTNKRLMLRSGFWGTDFKAIDYDRIEDLSVTVNPLENLLGVGTIRAFTGAYTAKGRPVLDRFTAIAEPYEVYRRLKQVSVDVKTDWNYPNALRPDVNPGYPSSYRERP